MALTMTETPARRQFKHMAGSVNHFLITILIGLDAVRTGKAERGPSFSTSWEPHDLGRSADRSGEFAIKALMSWLVDALDAYVAGLNRKPFLLQGVDNRNAFNGLPRSVQARTDWIAEHLNLSGDPAYALSALAIVWRNRLVHSNAENQVPPATVTILRASTQEIADAYQGLDVDLLLLDLERGGVPRFKEATALVRAAQSFVEKADAEILSRLDLEAFFREALAVYVSVDPSRRISNIWGKDPKRKLSSLRQLAMESGIWEHDNATLVLPDTVLIELAELRPNAVRRSLACPVT
jgi:hypothetical protein